MFLVVLGNARDEPGPVCDDARRIVRVGAQMNGAHT